MSPGTSVGRYRLEELVSRGGMGEVWRAYDATLGRQVAVKLLHAGVSEPADRERFVREARAAAQLNHPNVVAIFDVGEWSGRPFLVMELLNGRTCAEELSDRGPLPAAEVCDVGAQVASALSAAHAAGVVHRDIKPSNLVRTTDGTVKVVDFGIARVLDEASSRLTRTGTIVGTAAYLAPEQARGLPADARTDLYALGCVLYQLLAGRTPFVGAPTEVMYAHLYTPPDPPSRLRPDVPPQLEALVLAMLAKDPDDRPRDAATVRAALNDARPTQVHAAATLPPTAVAAAPDQARLDHAGLDAPTQRVAGTRHHTAVYQPATDRSSGADDAGTGHRASGPGTQVWDAAPGDHGSAPPQRPDRWRRLGFATLAGVVVVAVVGLLVGWAIDSLRTVTDPAGQADPSAPTTPRAPVSTPSPTPSPTPSEPPPDTTSPPPYGSVEWLERLDDRLSELADEGRIDDRVAERLRNRIEDALDRYAKGDADRVPGELRRLNRELLDAMAEGDLPVGDLRELFPTDVGDLQEQLGDLSDVLEDLPDTVGDGPWGDNVPWDGRGPWNGDGPWGDDGPQDHRGPWNDNGGHD